ncbi:MAG TPA: dienelactone hydrolase family protein [Candidatus Lustribacter sp.]
MISEEHAANDPGVLLVGVPPEARATIERFTARAYRVGVAGVRPDMDVERGLEVVRSARNALAARAGSAAQIAVVGYGFGGRYAFLAVTRLGADAAAAFHGTGIGGHLEDAPRVKKPLTFHFGDADERVPLDEVRAIKGALEGFGTTEIYRYPGAQHGFALIGAPGYDEIAALQAERRVFAVLDRLR